MSDPLILKRCMAALQKNYVLTDDEAKGMASAVLGVASTLWNDPPRHHNCDIASVKPVAHLVWLQSLRAADDVEDYYEVARPGDKCVDGSDPFPVYVSADLEAHKALIAERDARIAELEAALKPFAAMIERSDSMDREFLARTAPGIELEVYTPSTDKLVGSGEMRDAVYVSRGDFRRAWSALNASEREGA